MIEVLLVVHLMIALALVIVVLLQRSEGGGLGIGGGGGGGGMGGFMSARGTANLLTRSTAILAACFFGTSILLAILAETNTRGSIADQVPVSSEPAIPTGPAAPVSE
ncbi:preprotein translocase subunit SecG [Nisaea sp.]|uniref:preprotein translocase subunit SecG n=1 Tax=Nisaea sp. TaxID=2024842 RepID=UPI0032EAC4E2